jgi:hypothetical protein
MGANRGAVDAVVPALGHCFSQSNRDTFPDTAGAPASEPTVDRVPIAVFLRHIPPWRAGPQPPENAVDHIPIVFWRTATSALAWFSLNRQQNLQNTPFRFRQIATAQGCLPESAALNQFLIQASMILSTRPS